MKSVHERPKGPFGARIQPFPFGSVGIGGRFFIGFLERCTQQARLILPCWGKSLVKEKEWWFRAGTAPPDPAAPSLHGRGVTAAIPSSPDVADLLDHGRVFDTGDHLDVPAAKLALFYVDVENALQSLHPGHGFAAFGKSYGDFWCTGR